MPEIPFTLKGHINDIRAKSKRVVMQDSEDWNLWHVLENGKSIATFRCDGDTAATEDVLDAYLISRHVCIGLAEKKWSLYDLSLAWAEVSKWVDDASKQA